MPVFSYFCWVGAVLLALLFAVDTPLPPPESSAKPFQPNIRILSQVKPSEVLVFSGPTIDYGVQFALEIADLSARAVDVTSQATEQTRSDEVPQQAKPLSVAKARPHRPRKRYARRARPTRLAYQQVDHWSRSPFGVAEGLQVSPWSRHWRN